MSFIMLASVGEKALDFSPTSLSEVAQSIGTTRRKVVWDLVSSLVLMGIQQRPP
jgi:hypothetical protein